VGLSRRQLEKFKRLLVERITENFRSTRGDLRDEAARAGAFAFDTDQSPRDEADEALRVQLSDLRYSLDEREARLAQLMEEALHRMSEGKYGECVDCGNPIELDRLKLVPWATRCVDCQEQFEKAAALPRPSTL
jgi:DnaK suppressor protein